MAGGGDWRATRLAVCPGQRSLRIADVLLGPVAIIATSGVDGNNSNTS